MTRTRKTKVNGGDKPEILQASIIEPGTSKENTIDKPIISVIVSDKVKTNKNGNNLGRPSTLTSEIQLKLFNYLSIGTPLIKACDILGIDESQVYRRMAWDSDFRGEIQACRSLSTYKARNNVYQALDQGNLQVSTWYLERKERDEFGAKVEIDNNITLSQQDNKPLSEKLEQMIRDYNGKVDPRVIS